MAIKKTDLLLKCGITVTLFGSDKKNGEVSIIDLYHGYGGMNNFEKMAALFLELNALGYKPCGMNRVVGYYDSTDDLTLDFSKH